MFNESLTIQQDELMDTLANVELKIAQIRLDLYLSESAEYSI